MLSGLVVKGGIRAVAVGNGTAGRETESFVRDALAGRGPRAGPVVMVSEAGASVYSATDVAREEFPELDVTIRGAISIARRLQDPLAELVKIDPKCIGVGQYQHDVLTARAEEEPRRGDRLLRQPGRCRAEHRLLPPPEPRLGDRAGAGARDRRAARQGRALSLARGAAGRAALLDARVRAGRWIFAHSEAAHPLDIPASTRSATRSWSGWPCAWGAAVSLLGAGVAGEGRSRLHGGDRRLHVRRHRQGARKAGPRSARGFVAFAYRQDVHTLGDLEPGMICPGIVTNVTKFGAFVDIGVHQDGLVHISQLADRFVKDPREVVSPGDHVTVRVLEVKLDKNEIALTMKSAQGRDRSPAPPEARTERPPRSGTPDRSAPARSGGGSPARTPFNDAFAGAGQAAPPLTRRFSSHACGLSGGGDHPAEDCRHSRLEGPTPRVARGCRTSIAQPTSRRSPSHDGNAVRA